MYKLYEILINLRLNNLTLVVCMIKEGHNNFIDMGVFEIQNNCKRFVIFNKV